MPEPVTTEELADLFVEWARREGLLPGLTEDRCRDMAKAFMAGFYIAQAQRLTLAEVHRRFADNLPDGWTFTPYEEVPGVTDQ